MTDNYVLADFVRVMLHYLLHYKTVLQMYNVLPRFVSTRSSSCCKYQTFYLVEASAPNDTLDFAIYLSHVIVFNRDQM